MNFLWKRQGVLDYVPCCYIGRRLRWAGWVVSDMKEKYGTWRVYCHHGPQTIHDITHNGHAYIRYNGIWKWMYYRTYRLQEFLFITLLGTVLRPIQRKWYRQVYRMALQKFPEEAYGILMGAEYTELLIGLDLRLRRDIDPELGFTHIKWEENK